VKSGGEAEGCGSAAFGGVPHRRIGQKGKRGAIRIAEDGSNEFMENDEAVEAT
jgi:hypothetical protein